MGLGFKHKRDRRAAPLGTGRRMGPIWLLGTLMVVLLLRFITPHAWMLVDLPVPMPEFDKAMANPELMTQTAEAMDVPAPPPLNEIDPAAAKAVYNALADVHKHPKYASFVGRLGMVYHAHDFLPQARDCYEKAERMALQNYVWPYYLGLVAEAEGETDVAIHKLEQAKELREDYPPTWLRLGDLYMTAGRYEEAREAFQKYVELRPTDALGHGGLGRLANVQGEAEQAIAHLEQAKQLEPKDYRVFHALGQLYRDVGQAEQGDALIAQAEAIPKAIRLKDQRWDEVNALSTSIEAERQRLHADLDIGNISGALETGRLLIQRAPKNPLVHVDIARAHRAEGRYDKAVAAARHALQLQHDNIDAQTLLAILLHDQRWDDPDKLKEARVEADQAVKLDPTADRAWWIRSQVYEDLGDANVALDSLRQAIALRPSEATYWRELTRLYWFKIEDLPRAKEAMLRYLQLRPNDEPARRQLAELESAIVASQPAG